MVGALFLTHIFGLDEFRLWIPFLGLFLSFFYLFLGPQIFLHFLGAREFKGKTFNGIAKNISLHLGLGELEVYCVSKIPGAFILLQGLRGLKGRSIIVVHKDIEKELSVEEMRALILLGAVQFERREVLWKTLSTCYFILFCFPYFTAWYGSFKFKTTGQYFRVLFSFFYYPFLRVNEFLFASKKIHKSYDQEAIMQFESPSNLYAAVAKYLCRDRKFDPFEHVLTVLNSLSQSVDNARIESVIFNKEAKDRSSFVPLDLKS